MNTGVIEPSKLTGLLKYEHDTGKLYWLFRDRSMFVSDRAFHTWNTRFSGSEALIALDTKGYKCGRINGKRYLAHRVIWALVNGYWPDSHLDHINCIKTDNRIINIRECTPSENMKNRSKPITNTSGVKGVSWHKQSKKWCAKIRIDGKTRYLGVFEDIRDAAEAYRIAAIKHHGNFARTT